MKKNEKKPDIPEVSAGTKYPDEKLGCGICKHWEPNGEVMGDVAVGECRHPTGDGEVTSAIERCDGWEAAEPQDLDSAPSEGKPREITAHQCGAGMDEAVQVLCMDEPGPGGACHNYRIFLGINMESEADIHFQEGPVAEAGPNGISCEALLAVVIDRLKGFQSGPYACEENAVALDHCQRAIRTLHKRTIERAERNAEGRSVT